VQFVYRVKLLYTQKLSSACDVLEVTESGLLCCFALLVSVKIITFILLLLLK